MLKFASFLRLLLPLLVPVLENLLKELGDKFDPKVLLVKIAPRIREAVPGTIFDEAAVAIVGKFLSALDEALEDPATLKIIMDLISAGQTRLASKRMIDLALGRIFA